MNIQEFLSAYMGVSENVQLDHKVTAVDPSTGTEFNVIGLHHVPSSFQPGGSKDRLVIELER